VGWARSDLLATMDQPQPRVDHPFRISARTGAVAVVVASSTRHQRQVAAVAQELVAARQASMARMQLEASEVAAVGAKAMLLLAMALMALCFCV
jgi:hypothetical protein